MFSAESFRDVLDNKSLFTAKNEYSSLFLNRITRAIEKSNFLADFSFLFLN